MITVREATDADAQVIAELNSAFNGVQRRAEQIRERMGASGSTETILLAEELGSTLGFLCFQALGSVCYDTPWVEITELYVLPTHRGLGSGRALVEEAMRRAKEAGASELLLRTNTRNGAAQNLAARIGLEAAPQIVFRSILQGAA